MKKILLPLLLAASTACAQVTIRGPLPTGAVGSNYGINVLPGAQRQLSAILRGSTTMQVNWTVINTYGGGSATLDRTTNAIPLVNVTVGSTAGNCTIGGTLGAYTVTSTVGFTVRATSVDDATKTADYPFKVCANTTKVAIQPAYQQAYKTERVSLQSYVIGNVDESGNWSISTQPSGGDGALADTNRRDALFSATVSGRYVLTYTSAADATKSATAIVYVGAAIPSYGLSTYNLTASYPCEVDPAFTGTTFEVGAGQAYATPADANVAFVNAAPGSIMRIRNTDTTGTAPTTYNNYLLFDGQNKGGTPTQPKIVCGVPSSNGRLPILDAANATGQHGGNTTAYGVLSIWGNQNNGGTYTAGSIGPSYMTVAGLEIKNANETNTYRDFNNSNAVTAYGDFAACVNVRSGWYQQFVGLDLHDCRNGIYTQANGSSGFSMVTEFYYYRGNHFKNNSKSFVAGQHHVYNSTWYPVFEGNIFESLIHDAGGNMVKDRGQEPIYRYNAMLTTNGGYMNAINTPSDSPQYFSFEAYLGATGDTSCQTPYCGADQTLTANQLVANQQSMFKTFLYGNIYTGRNTNGLALVQLNDSEGDRGYDAYNQTEVVDHLGRSFFYSNTVDNLGQSLFAINSNGIDDDPQPFKTRIIAQNNIIYRANQSTLNILSMSNLSSASVDWKTNLFNLGTVDLTTPTVSRQFIARAQTPVNGWAAKTDQQQYDWNGVTTTNDINSFTISIDKHQSGINSTNFLFTSASNTKPYNSATFAPVASSDALNKASTVTDPDMAIMPVRSQYSMEQHRVIARVNNTTVGAVDSGSLPTLTSLALSTYAKAFLANQSGTCPYAFDNQACLPLSSESIYVPIPISLKGTYSNGLVADVGPDATWSAPSLTFYSDNEFAPNGSGPLSGTITTSYMGVNLLSAYGYNGGVPPTIVQSLINTLLGGSYLIGGAAAVH